jgi:tetratricopeptide (TPR) repeat protein
MNVRWQRGLLAMALASAAATPVLAQTASAVSGSAGNDTSLKDAITLTVSILAFVISAGVAAFNFWSWRNKNVEDAKKALTEAIVGMITTRQKLEEFRISQQEKYGNIESLSYRIALSDQRQLYLSKAQQILDRHERDLTPSYFEYMMLAANLIDVGRTADSVKLYEKSLKLANADNDEVGSAATRRVYGRAQIASGQYGQGRKEMLAAAADYRKLASRRAYDRDRMFDQAAETYRRLIWIEIQSGQMADVADDFIAMEALVEHVKDPVRRRALSSGLDQLRTALGERAPKVVQPPVTDARPDTPVGA